METLLKDLRYAVRMLLKGRVVTLIAILALMLGIGANTAIFSVINAVLLKPLPYPYPERLVRVYEKSPQFEQMSVSYPNFLDWQREAKAFERMAGLLRLLVKLHHDRQPLAQIALPGPVGAGEGGHRRAEIHLLG